MHTGFNNLVDQIIINILLRININALMHSKLNRATGPMSRFSWLSDIGRFWPQYLTAAVIASEAKQSRAFEIASALRSRNDKGFDYLMSNVNGVGINGR